MTDGMSLGRQQAGQLAGTLTGPPERGHGIASGIRVNQSFQRLHQLGVVLDQRLPSSSRVPYSLNGERWLSKALDSPIDGRTRESGKTGDAGNTPSSQLLCIDGSDKVLLPLIQVRKQQAVFLLEFFSCAHTNSVTQRASFVTIINVRDLSPDRTMRQASSDTGVMPQKILPCGIPRGLTDYQHALEESRFSEFRQHAGEDLQSEVLLITIAVGPTLEGSDLVVESLDESQGHLVLHVAVGLDAVPVSFDHIGELLKWLQALPPEGTPPVVEEPTSPGGSVVVPELTERLLEKVGLVQSLVGPEQQLQGLLSLSSEILPAGEQMVLLSLDEAAILPREACVLLLSHLVHGLPQVAEDVELVVHDPGLGSMTFLEGGLAERLPHIHDCQADSPALL